MEIKIKFTPINEISISSKIEKIITSYLESIKKIMEVCGLNLQSSLLIHIVIKVIFLLGCVYGGNDSES